MIIDLGVIACEDGKPLAVIRPDNPALAIRLANEALAKQDGHAFERILVDVQASGSRYTFAGWLSKDRSHVVDETGKRIDTLKPGDSFVDSDALQKMASS